MSFAYPNPQKINLVGGHNPNKVRKLSNETLTNWSVSLNNNLMSLVPTPGFTKIKDTLSKNIPSRGIFKSDLLDIVIIIIGNNVYTFDASDNLNLLQQIDTKVGDVYFAENDLDQIAISDGLFIYIYNTSDLTFVKATNTDGTALPFTPGTLTYNDTYFISNDPTSNKFYISQTQDGTKWGTLDETNDNNIKSKTVAVASLPQLLFIFGENITNSYYDTAGIDFPYSINRGVSYGYGCLNPATVSSSNGMIIWLGTNKNINPVILSTSGSELNIISNESIDNLLSNLKSPEDSNGFLYQFSNHLFYRLNFPTDNLSLIYDFLTKQFSIVSDENYGLNPIRKAVKLKNRFIAINSIDNSVFEFSNNIYTNNGAVIPRIRIPIILKMEGSNQEFIIDKLNLEMTTDSDKQIKIILEISKDENKTYPIKLIKTILNYSDDKTINFYNLGLARSFGFKFNIYSAGFVSLISSDVFIS
jgi:hypothetical protein